MRKCIKPKPIWWAKCISEEPDDKGGGAFCVELESDSIYASKDLRRLINYLIRAEKWLKRKEEYL